MNEGKILLQAIGCAVVIVAIMLLAIIHIDAIGEKAKILELTRLVNELGVDSRTEDILGKVVDVNMTIVSYRSYNKIPIIEYWVPDSIADLELIKIPK